VATYADAVYGIDTYGPAAYATANFTTNIEARSGSYLRLNTDPHGSISVLWSVPPGGYDRVRLVRNRLGIPVDELDGLVLVDTTKALAPVTYQDVDLVPSSYYYYSLFVRTTRVDGSLQWVRAGTARGLSVADHQSADLLLNRLPRVLTTPASAGGSPDSTTPLGRFCGLLGFQLDAYRDRIDALLDVNDADSVPGELLEPMLDRVGLKYEPEIGMAQSRVLARNALVLSQTKGTPAGISGLFSAVTGWGTTVLPMANRLLTQDDASADTSVGSWAVTSPLGSIARVATPSLDGGAFKITPAFETNLLTANQASLETDTTGWAGLNCTISRSTTQAFDGAASLALTSSGVTDIYAITPTGTAGVPVVGGQVYTAVAMFRAGTVGRSVRIYLDFFNSAGADLGAVTGMTFADNATGWQQACITAQAPSTAAYAEVICEVLAAGSGETHYVDAIGLFEDPTGNLVFNSDFEDGTFGWSADGSATIAPSTQAYTGHGSASLTYSAATFGMANQNIGPISAGVTLTFSAWVKGTAGRNVQVLLFNSTTSAGVGQAFVALSGSGWQRVSVTGTVASTGSIFAYIGQTSDAGVGPQIGDVLYLDAAQVVVGSTALPYIPPTTFNLCLDPAALGTGIYPYGSNTGTGLSYLSGAGFGPPVQSFVRQSSGAGYDTINIPTVLSQDGRTYTISFWYRAPSNNWAFQDTTDNTLTVGGLVGDYTWRKFSATVTTATAGNQFNFGVKEVSGGAWTGAFDMTAVQIEQGSVATPFVSGSLGPSYSWVASENLLSTATASFEDGTVGGVGGANGATTANSTARAYDGTHSLLVTLPTIAANGAGSQAVSPALAAGTYTYSVWTYLPAGSVASLTISVQANTATVSTVVGQTVTTTWAWVRQAVTFTVTAPGTVYLYVLNAAAATSGQTFYIDAQQLEQRPVPTPYGSTGAADASVSKRQAPNVAYTVLELAGADPLTHGVPLAGGQSYIYSLSMYSGSDACTPTLGGTFHGDVGAGGVVGVQNPPTTSAVNPGWEVFTVAVTPNGTSGVIFVPKIILTALAPTTLVYMDQIHVGPSSTYTDPRRLQILVAADRINEVPNAGFDNDAAYWTATGGSIARSTSTTYDGGAGAGLLTSSGTTFGANTRVYLDAGKTYTASAQLMKVGAGQTNNAGFTLTFLNSESVQVGSPLVVAPAVALSATAWVRTSVTFTVPAGVTSARLSLDFTGAAVDQVLIDDVLVERGSRLLDYFDRHTQRDNVLYEGLAGGSRLHYYRVRVPRQARAIKALEKYLPLNATYDLLMAQGRSTPYGVGPYGIGIFGP
jgi:hypothetical protein